jgi:hypothetical protein
MKTEVVRCVLLADRHYGLTEGVCGLSDAPAACCHARCSRQSETIEGEECGTFALKHRTE